MPEDPSTRLWTNDGRHECSSGCSCLVLERNRYFTGKYMTARDFSGEQQYFLTRHRLHNRLMHGWGPVCGLRVEPHPDPACRDRWVVVRAGIAIDCCGRELVLEEDTPFELPLPVAEGEGGGHVHENHEPQTEAFLVCLRYTEEPVELVPALYAEGDCDPNRREANRVRETARLGVCAEVDGRCWRKTGGDKDAPCRDDCGDDLPGPAGGCLAADCPCGEGVPLALISPKDEDAGFASGFEIDLSGRRSLPLPEEFFTHIVWTSWPHGEDVRLSDLRDPAGMNGRLSVRFDRRLLPADGLRNGINPFTFVVQYGGIQQDIEFLAYDAANPPGLDDSECVAHYAIDPDYLDGRRQNIAGNYVYVTIKCAFVTDCHGNAVAGRHLNGELPTGGDRGSTFESWFRIVPD